MAAAGHPTLVGLQGKVQDSSGNDVASADLTINISTSNSCTTDVFFSHDYPNNVSSGIFDIMLGSNYQLNLSYNKDYYLCIFVEGEQVGDPYRFRGGQGQIGSEDVNKTDDYTFGSVNITNNITGGDSIIPDANNTGSIGSSLLQWANGFFNVIYEAGSLLSDLYCKLTGCTISGDLNVTGNVNVTGNLNVNGTLNVANFSTPYGQVVTVAKSGGDFTTINDAYTYAKTLAPASDNRIMIKVMPGIYNETLTMDTSYIDLIGSGRYVSDITGNIDMNAKNCYVRSFTLHYINQNSNADKTTVIQDCYLTNINGDIMPDLYGKLLDSEVYISGVAYAIARVKETGEVRNCWIDSAIGIAYVWGIVDKTYIKASTQGGVQHLKSGGIISNSMIVMTANAAGVTNFWEGGKIFNSIIWVQHNDAACVGLKSPTSGYIVNSFLYAGGTNRPLSTTEPATATVYLDKVSSNKPLNEDTNVIIEWLSSHYPLLVVIPANDTTPSVKTGDIFKTLANTQATDITNFDDGQEGQIITVIGGSDTNASTLASGTYLHLSAGMTLGESDSITLVKIGTVWYEVSRSTYTP